MELVRWLGEVELTFNPSFYPSLVRMPMAPMAGRLPPLPLSRQSAARATTLFGRQRVRRAGAHDKAARRRRQFVEQHPVWRRVSSMPLPSFLR